jgi:hypothetical protein
MANVKGFFSERHTDKQTDGQAKNYMPPIFQYVDIKHSNLELIYRLHFLYSQENKMCYETHMSQYKVNSKGGHHRQNPRSGFQNLRLQNKGLDTSNMHMKHKGLIDYHSKDMPKGKVFKKWVKLQGQGY